MRYRNRSVCLLCLLLLVFIFPFFIHADEPALISGRITVFGSRIEVSPGIVETPAGVPIFLTTTGKGISGKLVGELRGPGVSGAVRFETTPGTPFQLPALQTKGVYFFEDIRLVNGSEVLASTTPDRVEIRVIDLLVSEIRSRPLTLDEIRELGIVINQEDFSATSFEVGLQFNGETVRINFPVLLPKKPELSPLIPVLPQNVGSLYPPVLAGSGGTPPPPLPAFVPVTFEPDGVDFEFDAALPDIPGILVFPNEIAFLNQFFSVFLMVRNAASAGSSLAVDDLTAQIVLNPTDVTLKKTNPAVPLGTPVPVRHPGADQIIGTADDVELLVAQKQGEAEFFVEGLKEGTHIIRMKLAGTLKGLVQGDVPIKGTATGAILVRNPNFSITFSHPSIVRAHEPYDLFITVTNTSTVDANLVRLTIPSNALVNCVLLDGSYRDFDVIRTGESATASFRVEPRVTGQVTAAVITSDGNVKGQFQFRLGVGEKGIPLSPNTLLLPEFTHQLGPEYVQKGLSVLGLAYSAATAPPGGLPPGVPYINRNIVFLRGGEMAQAAQRFGLGESRSDTLSHLLLDWLGNDVTDPNFDYLRRKTEKGRLFFDEVFGQMNVGGTNAVSFHRAFGDATAYRNRYLSVMVESSGSAPPLTIQTDSGGTLRSTGGEFGPQLDLPYADVLRTEDGAAVWALIGSVPDALSHTIRLTGTAEGGTANVSLLVPIGSEMYRAELSGLSIGSGKTYEIILNNSNPSGSALTITDESGNATEAPLTLVAGPALAAISAVQDAKADKTGHLVAVLFNRPVAKASAESTSSYRISGNRTAAARLQSGGRVVYLAFINPVSPFVDNDLILTGIAAADPAVASIAGSTIRVQTTVTTEAGRVIGRFLGSDGAPIPAAVVQIYETDYDDIFGEPTVHITATTQTNASGEFAFDYVRKLGRGFTIEAQDPLSGEIGSSGSIITQPNQLLRLDIILLGRGTVKGKVFRKPSNTVVPVPGALVTAVSLIDNSVRSVLSDASGNYVIDRVAVGPVNLSAQNQNLADPVKFFGAVSANVTLAGSVVTADIEVVDTVPGTVNGRVLQANGTDPIIDAFVVLSVPLAGVSTPLRLAGFTDETGWFQFDQVPAGTVTVSAQDRGTGQNVGSVSVNLSAGGTATVNIIAKGSGNIEVFITPASGMNLSDIAVYVENTAFVQNPVTSSPVLFQGVPLGNWSVKANNFVTGDLISGSATILYAGATATVSLRFPEKGTISGTVKTVDGALAPRATVLLFTDPQQSRLAKVTTTDNSGRYAFTNVDFGKYTVHAIAENLNDGGAGPTRELSESIRNAIADVKFLGKGQLTVHVETDAGPVLTPVKLTTVTFDTDGRIRRTITYTKSTNATTGDVVFEDLFRTGYTVEASTPFTLPARIGGKLSTPADTINILLTANPNISGTVHDADGNPIQASVTYTGGSGTQTVTSDANGSFAFNRLALGVATFTASAGATKGQVRTVIQEINDPIHIHLLGFGNVSGMVKNAAGDPVAGANLKLVVPGLLSRTVPGLSGPDGMYSFDNVPEGPITIEASNGSVGGRAAGNITHNGNLTLDVVLDAVGTVEGTVFQTDGTTRVSAAEVSLIRQGGVIGTTTSDGNGNYAFYFVPLSRTAEQIYQVQALSKNTGRRAESSTFLMTTNGQVVRKDLILEGLGNVGGFVFEFNGTTEVPGANLELRSSGVVTQTLMASSGAAGDFRFIGVPQGSYTITATKDRLAGQVSGAVHHDGEEVQHTIELEPAASISGVIVFFDGSALPAEVNPVVSVRGPGGISLIVDAPAGLFDIDQLPLGTYTLTTSFLYNNGTPYRGIARVTLTESGETPALLRLKGLNTLNVSIDGFVDGSSTVTLTYSNDMGAVSETRPVPDGTTTFLYIPESKYTLTARTGALLKGSASGEFTSDGETHNVTVTLTASGSVEGTVRRNATAAPSVSITLSGAGYTLFAYTDAAGFFRIDGVPIGAYTLTAEDILNGGKARVRSAIDTENEIDAYDLDLDSVAPQVVSTAPAAGQTAVNNNSFITVTFSEPMDAASLQSAFSLTSSAGKATGTIEVNGAVLTFTPSAPMQPQRTYNIVVTTAAEDVAGNRPAADFVASFTTVDTVAPTINTTVPIHMAFNVPLDAKLQVLFSETIADRGNYTITRSSGLSGNVGSETWNASRTVLTLQFATPLVQNERVTFSISGYSDTAGNVQSNSTIVYFDTIDNQPPAAPVLSSNDADNQIREGTSVTIFAAAEALSNVDFFVKGALQFHDTAAPYQYIVPASLTTIAANGSNQLVIEATATDRSGNVSAKGTLVIQLVPDTPPQVTVTTSPPSGDVFLGSTINVSYNATDDGTISKVLVVVTGGITKTIDAGSATTGSVDIFVPLNLQEGSSISIQARATDDSGKSGSSANQIFTAIRDTIAPQVTITDPSSGSLAVTEGNNFTISAGATDNVKVDRVEFQWNGSTVSDSSAPYQAQFVAPAVDQDTTIQGTVTAFDISGNSSSANFTVLVKPNIDVPTGTVTGTIFEADNVTPVANAQVTLKRNQANLASTVSDEQGNYQFNQVTLGSFTVEALNPLNGDRGSASNQLSADGEVRVVPVTLVGQGTVVVTVTNASGVPVFGASVRVDQVFNQFATKTTGADGKATFTNILSGPVVVTATQSSSGLSGTAGATVSKGATTPVAIQLKPTGSIRGQVFGPDGVTPSSGTRVTAGSRQATTGSNGEYELTLLPLGTYSVSAYDAENRLRDRKSDVTLSVNGQVAVQDLTFIGLGTVGGTVTSSGAPVSGIKVSLRSNNLLIGSTFTATTNGQGQYLIPNVPVGDFLVTVFDEALQLYGEASGLLSQDGQNVTTNIALTSNAVSLPRTLSDANLFAYDVQANGRIGAGSSTFGGVGSDRLSIYINAAEPEIFFNGASIGTQEDQGRELSTRQQSNLGGLEITRKVFVPTSGYFARYLEMVKNPTGAPITVMVRVLSDLQYHPIRTTSSGNATLDVQDYWLVADDDDGTNEYPDSKPSLALISDGPGAALKSNSVVHVNRYTNFLWTFTVQPGQTIGLLHFTVQQSSLDRAQASANRLGQLPPEVLSGLSVDEIASIANFVVAPDGGSQLTALPNPVFGSVTGRVYASDSATVISGASLKFRGQGVFYARNFNTASNSIGQFSLNNVTVDNFTLRARHPQTSVDSPTVSGSFAFPSTSTVKDVVFSNTGIVRGTVRRHTGTPVTSGTVRISGFPSYTTGIASNGAFTFTGLPPNAYTLTVTTSTFLTGTATVSVTAGQTAIQDVILESTGIVSGTVRNGAGNVASGISVTLERTGFSRSASTNSLGQYSFTDVPLGAFTVKAREPNSSVFTSAQISVAQDTTTVQDLMLIGLGTVQVQVNFLSGSAAANSNVEIQEDARGSSFRFIGKTDATGKITIGNVTVGNFVVRATHPTVSTAKKDATGQITANGQTVSVTVVLPALASVRVTVLKYDNTPYSGSAVQIRDGVNTFFRSIGTTDSLGVVTASNVAEGTFTLKAFAPGGSVFVGSTTGVVAAGDNGQTVDVTLRVLIGGRIQGTVYAADGVTTALGATVRVFDASAGDLIITSFSNGSGQFDISNVNTGDGGFRVEAIYLNGGNTITASTTDGFSGPNDIRTISIVLPASVVKGTVRYYDGSGPVTNLSIFLVQPRPSDGRRMFFSGREDQNGNYFVIGAYPGDFQLTAQNWSSGLSRTVTGTITDIADPVFLDVILPPTGFAEGKLIDSWGNPLSNRQVYLSSSGLFFQPSSSTNVQGVFRFEHVPVAPFTVQSCPTDACGSTGGIIVQPGETVVADIRLPGFGSVFGTVYSSDSVTPLSNATVWLESFMGAGTDGWYGDARTTNASGGYRFDSVPLGPVSLTAPSESTIQAGASAILNGKPETRLDLVMGTSVEPWSYSLNGTNGWTYEFDCSGEIIGAFGGSGYAYDDAYFGRINNDDFPCFDSAVLEDGTREMVFESVYTGSLLYSRKVFVPENGKFVRYLEILQNPTADPVTADVVIDGYTDHWDDTYLIVDPPSTGNTYAVHRGSSSTWLGYVMGGPGADVPVASSHFINRDGFFAYRWRPVVQPGETIILMHFAVPNNFAEAALLSDVQALVNLTNPLAVYGMTLLEQSQVSNFNIPVPDADNDGMPDFYEIQVGFDPNDSADAQLDTDLDGLSNLQEFRRNTRPLASDSDEDGLPDGLEAQLKLNPALADSDWDGINDGQEDLDQDGLTNVEELARGTDLNNADTDGDGINDRDEIDLGCDPLVTAQATTVTGRVIGTSGAPLAGVSAFLFAQPQNIAQTDSFGRFTIPGVTACQIQVHAKMALGAISLEGDSAVIPAISNGSTDVGDIGVRYGLPAEASTVSLYKFEEPAPGTSFDSSGNRNHGADTGTTPVNGPFGRSRQFNGINDFINMDSVRVSLQGAASWTLEFLARSLDGLQAPGLINPGCGNGWILSPGYNAGSISFGAKGYVGTSASCQWNSFGDAPVTQDTEWHYYALTWNGWLTLYRDGLPVGRISGSNTFLSNGSDPYFAAIGYDSELQRYFAGLADEVRVSRIAKSSDQIQAVWQGIESVLQGCDLTDSRTTTAVGRVIDSGGLAVQGASVLVVGQPGKTSITDSFGQFAIPGVRICPSSLRVSAAANIGGVDLYGSSQLTAVVPGGTADVGDIVLAPLGPLFAGARFPAGNGSAALASADFNHDGNIDLVSANWREHTITVLLGDGSGKFQTRSYACNGLDPSGVAVADVNEDGNMDIVTANYSSDDLSIFLGDGAGSFASATTIPAGDGAWPITVADFNGDNHADFAIGNDNSASVSVLLGNGDGTFGLQQITVGNYPESVTSADVNNDSKTDLIVANTGDNTVSILFGNGDGSFQPQVVLQVGGQPGAVIAADFNADGVVDLATSNYSSKDLSVLFGTSPGSFALEKRFGSRISGYWLATKDLNNDGRTDLIVPNLNSDDISVFISAAGNSFAPELRFVAGDVPGAVLALDVNSDQLPDLAVADSDSKDVVILFGSDSSWFQAPAAILTKNNPATLAVGDFNLDGNPDVAVANANSNSATVAFGKGNGDFGTSLELPVGVNPYSIAVGDVNNDGRPDIVTGNCGSNTLTTWISSGVSAFSAQYLSHTFGICPGVSLGDLNNDGKLDAVTPNWDSNDVSILIGSGVGFFSFNRRISLEPNGNPNYVTIHDLNGDGNKDLVVANYTSGKLSVLLGNGDGSFQPEVRYFSGAGTNNAAVADVNGDGNPDLIAANYVAATVAIFYGNGNGTFQQAQTFPVNSPGWIQASDLNGDSVLDLVITNSDTNSVTALIGSGDGTFLDAQNFIGGANPTVIAISDVNRDGKPDLIFTNFNSNNVYVLLHR